MMRPLARPLLRALRFGLVASSVGLVTSACRTVIRDPGVTPPEPLDWASLDTLGYTPLPLGRIGGISPTASAAVPPHSVVGAVYDDLSGEPLRYVSVLVPGPGLPHTSTDSLGRFVLTGVDGEHDTIFIHRIGYTHVHLDLTLPADRGIAVVVALRRNTLVLCPAIITDPHALILHLRDVATGLPPTREVEVRAAGPDTTDVVHARPAPASADSVAKDSVMTVRAGLSGASRYDVLVRARGYHDWTARRVRVTSAACGYNVRSLDVWLVPSS